MTISEADWKRFKKIRQVALDRYCTAFLAEAGNICSADEPSAHDRYLALYSLMQERNKAMKMPFDGLSRNSALLKLKIMIDMDLLTDEEIQSFDQSIL